MKILIIEDSQELVNSLKLCFQIQWPEAQTTYTNLGLEGVRLATMEKPDIIILDLGLPDIDGTEVLKQIRSTSNIPIIILSVRSDASDRLPCFQNGANEYVTKPFRALSFMETIKKTFDRWQKEQKINN